MFCNDLESLIEYFAQSLPLFWPLDYSVEPPYPSTLDKMKLSGRPRTNVKQFDAIGCFRTSGYHAKFSILVQTSPAKPPKPFR